jgi:hypothetical protein
MFDQETDQPAQALYYGLLGPRKTHCLKPQRDVGDEITGSDTRGCHAEVAVGIFAAGAPYQLCL